MSLRSDSSLSLHRHWAKFVEKPNIIIQRRAFRLLYIANRSNKKNIWHEKKNQQEQQQEWTRFIHIRVLYVRQYVWLSRNEIMMEKRRAQETLNRSNQSVGTSYESDEEDVAAVVVWLWLFVSVAMPDVEAGKIVVDAKSLIDGDEIGG